MPDFLSTQLGQKFCNMTIHSLNQIADEIQEANHIAAMALYPYPDLCRRCKYRDTNRCVNCCSIPCLPESPGVRASMYEEAV